MDHSSSVFFHTCPLHTCIYMFQEISFHPISTVIQPCSIPPLDPLRDIVYNLNKQRSPP